MGKSFCLLILLLGIIMITIGYTRKMILIDKSNKIEYRLVPEKYYDQQFKDQYLTSLDIFKDEKINFDISKRYGENYEINNDIFGQSLSNFILNDR